ncbi:MAG TPA: hypothetical protein VJQ25_05065, partial [Nitrospira sp.]|nr:hypothetical protein [Nitrospira sp.]
GGDDSESIYGDFGLVSFQSGGFQLPSFRFIVHDVDFVGAVGDGFWGWGGNTLEVDVSETLLEPFHGTALEALRYALGIDAATNLNTIYDDYIEGGGGNDSIWGGNGSDTIFGGSGDDILIGDGLQLFGPGVSQQWASELVSVLGAPGDDYIDGGAGNDVLGDDPRRVNLDSMGGSDVLIGGEGNDVLTNIDPVQQNFTYSNYLDGGEGDDILRSDNGSSGGFDTLIGGPGNDSLTIGNRGQGEMDGGSGNDTFTVGLLADVVITDGAGSDSYVATILDPALILASFPGQSLGGIVINDYDASASDFDTLSIDVQSFGGFRLSITRDESNLYFG